MTALLSLSSNLIPEHVGVEHATKTHESSDEQLVEAVLRGHTNAFDVLVERHEKRARQLAFSLVKDVNDACDIVQDAFLRAYRKLGEYSRGASFYTWFYRIVYNLSVDFLRKPYRKRVELSHLEPLLGALAPLALPRTPSRLPDELVSGFELLEQISDAFEQLSMHHRNVVLLREVLGMNYGEIAETLGCAKGTVMSRLFHARERLQELLGDVHSEHFDDESGATGNQR